MWSIEAQPRYVGSTDKFFSLTGIGKKSGNPRFCLFISMDCHSAMVSVICDTLCGYGVIDKLLSLPGDNTLNNVTMAHSLKGPGKLPSSHIASLTTHVLCAGHIFDLTNRVGFVHYIKRGSP